ncbi:ATP-binding cassette sub-family G member 8 [Agrilus planipennis]|uniref:ATP-binding cassette sub-family G member 8 n=1 Tax=Agrilus planipennis TaxID=224129 RepID=A0A1W4XS33_AGRPL|nr:ATP-binding cassette sub-family G member 8 [Agrilus planipennis]
MVRSRTPSQGGGSQSYEMERKYSVPSNPDTRTLSGTASEDLHAWSIYRQNLNSDFTDSALGSTDKSPLPYGNFQLRDTTVQSILSHPRYGPKSALGSNMYTYLKFGLPRVLPPNHNGSNKSGTPQHFKRGSSSRPQSRIPKSALRSTREGSSGYDSSDNETTNHYKQSRKYRSDPDFRMQHVHPSYYDPGDTPAPLAALHQGGIRTLSNWNRNKSISEANLLATEYKKPINNYPGNSRGFDPRRNSVAGFIHHQDVVDHSGFSQIGISKAESHLSAATSRRVPSVLKGDYLTHDPEDGPTFLYPHLQVIGLGAWPNSGSGCFGNRSHLLLSNVSFEAHGGEVLAVMATSEAEGTGLLDIIAGLKKQAFGSIFLNGQTVSPRQLLSRVAYVQNDAQLCKDMTTVQTLRFHYDLRKPTEKLQHIKVGAIDRINILIEDLGLEQVRNTKVCNLTTSERRRLNVACHLLMDTDIVLLNQPTRGMDIFDTFFLVEYLRQWASGGAGNSIGRIVIITLHPPTYEIFTMLSRILLLSAGRVMYSGKRKNMLQYFAMVDYPCPSFKNPSDYYLDLVTLDDLSAEAMLESSQRIEQLAEIFQQKHENFGDPGPPSALPMTVKQSNFFQQAFVLFTKAMFYTQPNTFIYWIMLIITSASLSLITGAIFWDVPNSDSQLILNDRLGYHYTMMSVTIWPILLMLTLMEMRKNKNTIERDIKDGLYGKFTYAFVKIILNLFPSLFVWLIYIVPSYSMSGLYMQGTNNYNGFYMYLGYMLLYLSCVQILLTAFYYLIPFSNAATLVSSFVITSLFLSCGYTIHVRDIPFYFQWIQYISPSTWLMPYIIRKELTPEAISSSMSTQLCRNKQVQRQDIIVQLPCPPPNGTQVLFNYGYLPNDKLLYNYGGYEVVAMVVFYAALFLAACFAFVIGCRRKKSGHRFASNKP